MKFQKSTLFLLPLLLVMSCASDQSKTIDIQGHRGCRGLMPENTLAAFKKGLELGVTTLEMDVVISNDFKVVVSHEPWFNYEITTTPENQYLSEMEGRDLNIYKMNYSDIRSYDVGKKIHPRFTEQKKLAEKKPLLSEVIKMAENYCSLSNREAVRYNIEIKSTLEDEQKEYQPIVSVFCDLVMMEINNSGIKQRCTIQSFDTRVLNYMHEHYPKQELSFLVEENSDYKSVLKTLHFKPQIYSCDFALISLPMINDLHSQNIKVIPWTVNKRSDMKAMLKLGVDGIISDYPDKVIKLVSEN